MFSYDLNLKVIIFVMPQNLLQEHDSHFAPQTQMLKVETTQTFVL